MAVQFDIGAFVALLRAGTYSFTLTPKTALMSDVTIRWAIVPKGATAVVNDFSSLTGTLSLSSGSTTTQAITVTPTDDALATLSGEFEIQIYQVVADGDDILLASQDVTFSDAETGAGVATVETPPAPPSVEGPEPETEPVIQAESAEQSFEVVEEQTTVTQPETEATPQAVVAEPETAFLINPASYTLLSGTKGDDTIAGTSATELIQGGHYGDTITTGGGDDVVIGGFGRDTIILSVDDDGNGAEHAETVVYRYNSISEGGIQGADGDDTITGFSRGVDKLILAELGAAYYIENIDAVADKSDITEDIIAQGFASNIVGYGRDIVVEITLNDSDLWERGAKSLTDEAIDAGARWGIKVYFSAAGWVNDLLPQSVEKASFLFAGNHASIYFDKETTIWLEKQENWDKVTDGDGYSKDHIESLEGLRYLFGDSDENDDLLQFALDDGLGVEVGTPDVVTTTEPTPKVVDDAPETAFLINPASYTLLTGTKGDDTIAGTSATELIQGGHYGDTITTGGGDDVVIGGFGSDTIILSVDDDGNGAEHAETVVYRYNSIDGRLVQGADGEDAITGFSRGVDKFILAEMSAAYYIENNDAVADKSDITEDIITQEFVSQIDGYGRGIVVEITLNDWWGLDWDTDWGADGLSTRALDAGFRLGISVSFSGAGWVNDLLPQSIEKASFLYAGNHASIYFDRETSIWLGKQENWDKVTNDANGLVESLEGLRYLFGDSDENDDLLQFTTADGLGVDVL